MHVFTYSTLPPFWDKSHSGRQVKHSAFCRRALTAVHLVVFCLANSAWRHQLDALHSHDVKAESIHHRSFKRRNGDTVTRRRYGQPKATESCFSISDTGNQRLTRRAVNDSRRDRSAALHTLRIAIGLSRNSCVSRDLTDMFGTVRSVLFRKRSKYFIRTEHQLIND